MSLPDSLLVTVVIPAFNVGPYVRRCVDSVLRQTHRQLEVIVVNDASTDDTAAVLDALASEDSRLHVIHLTQNVGVHAARWRGVEIARGEYIGFVDADDWIAAGMYVTLCAEAVRADADVVICGAVTALSKDQLGAPKVRFRRRRCVTSDILDRFCRFEFGSGVLWNKLYSAALVRPFAGLPLPRPVDAAEDYVVNVGCFAKARRVVTLPAELYYYFERPESASRAGANARGFCRVLHAYTACVALYAELLTAAELRSVEDMYARQLSFASYQVAEPDERAPYREGLQSIVRRLADVHPSGVYSVVHTFRRTNGRTMLKLAVRTLLTRFRQLAWR